MSIRHLITGISCALLAIVHGSEIRPNVLMIVVDDLKPVLGCYGDAHAKTPHMDALAARGMLFREAYANQAVCGPSRCSLFSGLRPDRTKVHDLQTDFYAESPWVTTLPELLRSQGYDTAACGKVFHGGASDHIMEGKAFTEIIHDGNLPFNASHAKPALFFQNESAHKAVDALPVAKRERWHAVNNALRQAKANPSTECLDLPDDAYNDGAAAKQGIDFIERFSKRDKPFFITVGFRCPHLPFIAPKRYWEMYDRATLPAAPFAKAPEGAPKFAMSNWGELRNYADIPRDGPLDPAKARELVHGYYASTSYVDAQIGKLLDALKQRGLEENTIVVLWGDHGWHLGDHGMWCKHTNYEQATRTTLMFAGPGVTQGKSNALTELIDVYPSICDLTGIKPPTNLDAQTLMPVLAGKATEHRKIAHSQYPRFNGTMGYALRDHRFRYVAWVDDPKPKSPPAALPTIRAEELYDYTSDAQETKNLAQDAALQKQVEHFRAQLAEFLASQTERISKQPIKTP